MPVTLRACARAAVALLAAASPAVAQVYEAVGTRAQGMGGAFVAVADDATATWWNPAGLATGALFSLVVEQVRLDEPGAARAGEGAWTGRSRGYAVAFPALGLSHYRLRVSEIDPAQPNAATPPDRQDGEAGAGPGVRSLAANEFGITVGQSLGGHLVIASTVKLVRGGLIVAEAEGDDPLDRVEDLDVRLHTRADLDLGIMASLGAGRVGLSIRHLREPTFGNGVNRLTLSRQARLGAALVGEWAGQPVTAALDVDLTRTATRAGDVRRVAGGVEAWLFDRSLGLRGGVSTNTVGVHSYTVSGGLSVALQDGLYVEGAATTGSDRARAAWAVGLAMTY